MAGESRSELIAWTNDLLQINYAKIEQFGSGAAYCQILDSIFGDVPMSRVNFAARQEYEYLNNFKVLQKTFKDHKIDKPIPVDRLVKCKMQDNLEFTQWIRRFHDQCYGGGHYDAVGRRKGAPAAAAGTTGGGGTPTSSMSAAAGPSGSARLGGSGSGAPAAARGKTSLGGGGGGRPGGSSTTMASNAATEKIHRLTDELAEVREHVGGLETERDFYFAKLRDIEVIVQEKLTDPATLEPEKVTLLKIQEILYSTEEGFEVPDADLPAEQLASTSIHDHDEETF